MYYGDGQLTISTRRYIPGSFFLKSDMESDLCVTSHSFSFLAYSVVIEVVAEEIQL